ncbi:hypothetical protein [Bosea lupini]|uniref:hypothetical protein n=1 Tax=Bosea lupini TaxID=1036779 RepID=UPI001160A3A0|nr:hypothetical protein [Bosea lupini]
MMVSLEPRCDERECADCDVRGPEEDSGAAVRADKRFDAVDKRFDELGDLVRKQRRDTAGLLVMAKAVTGDFAEQVAAIEERVRVLEARGC